jgi:hypothetical protein
VWCDLIFFLIVFSTDYLTRLFLNFLTIDLNGCTVTLVCFSGLRGMLFHLLRKREGGIPISRGRTVRTVLPDATKGILKARLIKKKRTIFFSTKILFVTGATGPSNFQSNGAAADQPKRSRRTSNFCAQGKNAATKHIFHRLPGMRFSTSHGLKRR